MKKPIVKCPKCGSENTREYITGVGINMNDELLNGLHIFSDDIYSLMTKEFGNMADTDDYYCAKNICDDCKCDFVTKNMVKIEVTNVIAY